STPASAPTSPGSAPRASTAPARWSSPAVWTTATSPPTPWSPSATTTTCRPSAAASGGAASRTARRPTASPASRPRRSTPPAPPRPDSWPAGEPWLPDNVFALVQAGLLQGKSIGFLPTRVHAPDPQECERHGWGDDVRLVIDEWLLLEYACVTLPANQDALVEAVSKGSFALGGYIPFTPLTEVQKAVREALGALDLDAVARQAVREALDRARGRV